MNVLIAEDTRSIRMIIAATVAHAGHLAIEAANGCEAMEIIKEREIDLVVMGAEMPEMDGFEATELIRQHTRDDWIPIIFLSAHDEDDYIQRALDVGADVYLQKPINAVQLLGQIKALERISDMKSKLHIINEELQAVNRVLENVARLDGLTQIANRRVFDERIEIEVARCFRNNSPLSLMICDIDSFKDFNDTYGHLVGDKALKQVAKSIEGCFHRATDLIARHSGDNFFVLLPDTPVKEAYRMTEKMLATVLDLAIPHKSSKATNLISISIGVAFTNGELRLDKEQLILNANEALCEAKESGRNRAVLSDKEQPMSELENGKSAQKGGVA